MENEAHETGELHQGCFFKHTKYSYATLSTINQLFNSLARQDDKEDFLMDS